MSRIIPPRARDDVHPERRGGVVRAAMADSGPRPECGGGAAARPRVSLPKSCEPRSLAMRVDVLDEIVPFLEGQDGEGSILLADDGETHAIRIVLG